MLRRAVLTWSVSKALSSLLSPAASATALVTSRIILMDALKMVPHGDEPPFASGSHNRRGEVSGEDEPAFLRWLIGIVQVPGARK
jgi:hypothetical protein